MMRVGNMIFLRLLTLMGLALAAVPARVPAREFHVGPGRAFETIGAVPWYRLAPGDTVFIHYRPAPYFEKFLISTRGTESRWIRVLGVPGPNGELPIISGRNATTSAAMHYRWQDANGGSAIQHLGVVQIAPGAGDNPPLPAYIEIAGLRVQDGFKANQFSAENGTRASYDGFAACIYARSVQHLIVRDNVLADCGQGFYNWTGSSSAWWEGLQTDTVVRGNEFIGNGNPGSYTEHQSYTESDGVTYEFNRFGPMRAGARGSQIKDRSAGTVIRYNAIEAAPAGWMIDLVEPENGYAALGLKDSYRYTFLYGNVLVSRDAREDGPNMVHWNEDHQQGVGRAVQGANRLFFYHNTVVVMADRRDVAAFHLFNTTWGGYDCPDRAPAGIIDVRNNILAALPRTPGAQPAQMTFAYCPATHLAFGANWVSPGLPGFVSATDFHLVAGSPAAGIGGALAPEVMQRGLAPLFQYVDHHRGATRATSGAGADAGAFELRR
jgi:hypothetical protein